MGGFQSLFDPLLQFKNSKNKDLFVLFIQSFSHESTLALFSPLNSFHSFHLDIVLSNFIHLPILCQYPLFLSSETQLLRIRCYVISVKSFVCGDQVRRPVLLIFLIRNEL